ncbi:hypothetical protein K7X08_015404 [Anisodus acutangulus]|uniref:Uncharacterized protein n=1 Tax=Anisodus acutangulus TaxID=402998 RepID=A0A9Q1QUI5_9SOLA|nr:hypothetical protein K7X08_015404 [Anisodus acutangulus]
MSIPIEEHDYIGISEKSCVSSMDNNDLNFKATELRLGLPGSESPPLGVLKNFPSGAKRGFFDTINGNSGTWVFGSDANNSGFSSPKGVKVLGNKILGSVCPESVVANVVKEELQYHQE